MYVLYNLIYILYSVILYLLNEHIGHAGKMSVSGYSDQWFKPRLHQYAMSLNKTLIPHCFSRLCCEKSTRQEHPPEVYLFSDMSCLEEIALNSQGIF